MSCNRCFGDAKNPHSWEFKLDGFKRPIKVVLCRACYEKVLPTAQLHAAFLSGS